MSNLQINLDQTGRIENLSYLSLERAYLHVQRANTVITYILLMGISLLWLLANDSETRLWGCLLTEGALCIALMVNLWILPKAYSFKGFAIREHDITYRSGILFPSVITIPFCKIQQVSVTQTPVSRCFGLYTVKIVNGAQMQSETHIPGLTEERANEIKTLVIDKIRHENH